MSYPNQYWIPPIKTVSSYLTGLHMQNSLVQSLQEFVPHKGKKVTWYMCGPTVYDHSHLGHARTYIGFDTIKKIMRDYFKYDIEVNHYIL
jgi:cysteinyl-tRNA synthetase